MVGIAFQEHLATVDLQSEAWTEIDGTDTELVVGLVGNRSVLA